MRDYHKGDGFRYRKQCSIAALTARGCSKPLTMGNSRRSGLAGLLAFIRRSLTDGFGAFQAWLFGSHDTLGDAVLALILVIAGIIIVGMVEAS